jgi:hypothetical protein
MAFPRRNTKARKTKDFREVKDPAFSVKLRECRWTLDSYASSR